MAIESSPPAFRVQTEAEASVHGTTAAINNPPNIRSGKTHIVGRQTNGTTKILIPIASNAGSGRVKLWRIVSAFKVTPIAHMTAKTIELRNPLIFNTGCN
jgi:hypothetical protein